MTNRWYVVVSYDVADDRRRRKVAKLLLRYGERVQYSVFDCLLTEKRLLDLEKRLRKLIDEGNDSIRFYKLCSSCERMITVRGRGRIEEDESIIVI